MTGSHRWDIDVHRNGISPAIGEREITLIEIAQGLLERGTWTIPSWTLEQYLAERFRSTLGWTFKPIDGSAGSLGFSVASAYVDEQFTNALVTARWKAEVESVSEAIDALWSSQRSDDKGSAAEAVFLREVLAPVLEFPLLDYLQLQRELPDLGVDPQQFFGQRADFVLDTGRGLKLVIEVDGEQHNEPKQKILDNRRDAALREAGWYVWRVKTSELDRPDKLQAELASLLRKKNGKPHWGVMQRIDRARGKDLMTCVWGATVAHRIQFLLLEALRRGLLPWEAPWQIGVVEHDTDIAEKALQHLEDWFGRLRELYGFTKCPPIASVEPGQFHKAHLVLDISAIAPYRKTLDIDVPVAWSRPANRIGPLPRRRFLTRLNIPALPQRQLLNAFIQDFFRKSKLREGQFEIICRILQGQDVIGLLPTGSGKSLTYQLSGLLLGGLTIYVSPLKSLLQDQHERLIDLGIDLATEISSSLDTKARQKAGDELASGAVRYLLVAPERFLMPAFREVLDQYQALWGTVCQVVIDECHCVCEWGHDFRPAYLVLSRIARQRTARLRVSAPLVALTGTASSIVLADVQRELGIQAEEAVIRAKRLDRPEITLRCLKVQQRQKETWLKRLVDEFLRNHPSPAEGVLIFCRFVGRTDGVLSVASAIASLVPHENLRFFCGTDPDWRSYAAFWTKKKAATLSETEVQRWVPSWALSTEGKPALWDEVKAQVQRDFISGLPGNFQVLVATNAFGMGIDKPSVRRVIHYTTPQSPEAYYQEVGRAGRDKKQSEAVLLFSDENPDVTDRLLSPGLSVDEAKTLYARYRETNRYGGGDFIQTFYFHQNSFAGRDIEAKAIVDLLRGIRARLATGEPTLFRYEDATEKDLEYAVVRLIYLGVVNDCVKDYNAKTIELELCPEWQQCRDQPEKLRDYLAAHLVAYIRRYRIHVVETRKLFTSESSNVAEIEANAAQALIDFIYDVTERKRRQASRQMLDLARLAVDEPQRFSEELMLYLQFSEKFTRELEAVATDPGPLAWKKLLDLIDNRDDVKELHGSCQRVVESYPTHPGLLSISAATRFNPTLDGIERSIEELQAALRFAMEMYSFDEALAIGDNVTQYCRDVDKDLADSLESAYGIWLIENGRPEDAITRFPEKKNVRNAWLANLLRSVKENLPTIEGV